MRSFDDLAKYCYYVAGAVGLSCIHLWGFHDERAVAAAIDCGTAFQLTSIFRRRAAEDALRGRIYLPREDLERFQLSADELATHDYSRPYSDGRVRQLLRLEVSRAPTSTPRASPVCVSRQSRPADSRCHAEDLRRPARRNRTPRLRRLTPRGAQPLRQMASWPGRSPATNCGPCFHVRNNKLPDFLVRSRAPTKCCMRHVTLHTTNSGIPAGYSRKMDLLRESLQLVCRPPIIRVEWGRLP